MQDTEIEQVQMTVTKQKETKIVPFEFLPEVDESMEL